MGPQDHKVCLGVPESLDRKEHVVNPGRLAFVGKKGFVVWSVNRAPMVPPEWTVRWVILGARDRRVQRAIAEIGEKKVFQVQQEISVPPGRRELLESLVNPDQPVWQDQKELREKLALLDPKAR